MVVFAVEVLSRDAPAAQILIRKLVVSDNKLVRVLYAHLVMLEAWGLFIEELVDCAPATSCSLSFASIWLVFLHQKLFIYQSGLRSSYHTFY